MRSGIYTIPELYNFYSRFNDAYFHGMLPLPESIHYVERMPTEMGGALGIVKWRETAGRRSYTIMLLRPYFAGRDSHLVLATMLHEMVHIYVSRFHPECREVHGPVFTHICERLQKLGWNVDVTLNSSRAGYKLTDRRDELSSLHRKVVKLAGQLFTRRRVQSR